MKASITTAAGDRVETEGSPQEILAILLAVKGARDGLVPTGGPRRGSSRQTRSGSTPASSATSKARQLQGQYMGLIRQLPASSKAKVRSVLESTGKAAAIAEARRLLAK